MKQQQPLSRRFFIPIHRHASVFVRGPYLQRSLRKQIALACNPLQMLQPALAPRLLPRLPLVLLCGALVGTIGNGKALADALSELPERWVERLQPVTEADISGAEPLMQQALREAREAVAQQLLQADPDRVTLGRAYGRLGARLLLLEVETQADACLRNAMQLDPGELRWPYYAGYMAMLAGNLERALGYLEQASKLDDGYPTLAVRLGKVQLDRGNLTAARAAFEQVVAVPALRAPVQYYLGQIALLERRYEAARGHLEAALDANPDATEVHYPLARAYQGLGLEAEARAQMERFVLRSPQIDDPLLDELRTSTQRALPAFERAMHAVRQADYVTAADEFAAGLAIRPDNAAARVSYARVRFLRGEQLQAEQALQQLINADQEAADSGRATAEDLSAQASAWFFLGVLRQANGSPDQAAQAYRAVLAADPEHAGALFQLANLDFAAGQYRQAASGYQATLKADPKAAPARLLALIAGARAGVDERQLVKEINGLRKAHPADDQLAYAEARLLAAARSAELRDPVAALEIARRLTAKAPIPPHQRLLALATAASGSPERGAEILAALITSIGWMAPPAEQRLIAREHEALVAGELPQPPWPAGDPLLSPPSFDAKRLFRDYPALVPF
ncbi:MAG: hypothetical protein C1943_16940 [Halochromatium sp.]|nr:hypothetical protein [Halochromatium sp.]